MRLETYSWSARCWSHPIRRRLVHCPRGTRSTWSSFRAAWSWTPGTLSSTSPWCCPGCRIPPTVDPAGRLGCLMWILRGYCCTASQPCTGPGPSARPEREGDKGRTRRLELATRTVHVENSLRVRTMTTMVVVVSFESVGSMVLGRSGKIVLSLHSSSAAAPLPAQAVVLGLSGRARASKSFWVGWVPVCSSSNESLLLQYKTPQMQSHARHLEGYARTEQNTKDINKRHSIGPAYRVILCSAHHDHRLLHQGSPFAACLPSYGQRVFINRWAVDGPH